MNNEKRLKDVVNLIFEIQQHCIKTGDIFKCPYFEFNPIIHYTNFESKRRIKFVLWNLIQSGKIPNTRFHTELYYEMERYFLKIV